MQKSAGVFLLTAFCTLTAMAQGTFVYTNNDQVPNSISAFSAAANGTLSSVAGSPFATGGNRSVGGFSAANRITRRNRERPVRRQYRGEYQRLFD